MRVVFMGTPDFAVPSLVALAREHEVVGVFSRPDSVSGRGRGTRPSPVSTKAAEMDLPLFRPRTLRDIEQLALLRSLGADIIAVAAYGLILPAEALEAAPLGAVNVHASLLPRWRGAAPIQRAILAGDAQTGVSIMRMEVGLDTGPYCSQVATTVADKDAAALTDELAHKGAEALMAALPSIADGTARWVPQDEARVTYAEKVTKADVAIAPEMTTSVALRHIRGSLPAAPCRVSLCGRGATLLSATNAPRPVATGKVSSAKQSLALGFADGALEITRMKPDGKNAMDAIAWARGVRDLDDSRWEGLS